jgi:hypothetical protein
VRADQHHVGNVDRRLPVQNPPLSALPGVRFHVAFDHIHALDQYPVTPGQNLDDPAALALIFAGYYSDPVILANIDLYVHILDRSCVSNRFFPQNDRFFK